MIIEALHAWVLHKRWIGDTSAQATFFTFEQGIITCLYRGGRTPKKQSLLQEFTPLWVAVNQRGDRYYIRQIEIVAATIQFTGHNLFAALYMNELLYYFLCPNDEYPELYKAYESVLKTLTAVNSRFGVETVLRRFEWQLLVSCGYQMSLTHDVDGRPILADRQYQLLDGHGFMAVGKGILGQHILAFSQDRFTDVATLKAVKWIMRRAIDFALDGRAIKARELYKNNLRNVSIE
ncbi:DNA repair protein RecO [Legionella nagasakiensis]|uniref:DNA repair protein RecO n=1 Tax=Legionella nagasakiensis TaxID=535290 RepID=UPI001A944A08|nr:DNA repair protein RecO [Legionella nagasakiensis]